MKRKLRFQNNMTVGEVKEQFQALFPYLKLEFFGREADKTAHTHLHKAVGDTVRLWEISTFADDGYISFPPTQPAGAFEQCLQIHFGLPVKIYRKGKNCWVEAGHADGMSLEQQNAIGAAACRAPAFNAYTLFL